MATYLNFPYDPEIFDYAWKNEPDVALTNMLESGAVVNDAEIARLISNGSNFYTIPYYDVLDGTPVFYDGATDITTSDTTGGSLAGVVYGRAKGWNVKSFIKDFNSGADPMQAVVRGVAKYWAKQRQLILMKTLKGVFGVAAFSDHVIDNNVVMGETTIGDAIVSACGDNADGFSLAIMHSVVANKLANLQMLNYAKYTDAMGIQRNLPIADINGMRVIINDGVEKTDVYAETTSATAGAIKVVADSATPTTGEVRISDTGLTVDAGDYVVKTNEKYATYVLGESAVGFASAPVDVPSEMVRDASTNGGQDQIYTRVRETFMPYGFAFSSTALSNNVGVSDTSIATASNWSLQFPAKAIKMVKVVTTKTPVASGS